jgi:hypothetical protein
MRGAVAIVVALLAVALAPSVQAKPTVSPADRAAINRLLDVFVPAAIGRSRSVRAWPLTTPAMRQGSDRREWQQGLLPVTPFPVVGSRFHGWTADRIAKDSADIVLLVHLRKGSPLGAVSFNLALRKIGGRWLVDSAAPAATFSAAGSDSQILAQPDFAPSGGQAFSKSARISQKWVLIIPGILFGLIVLTPIIVLTGHRVRERTVRRERMESDRRRVFRNLSERPH